MDSFYFQARLIRWAKLRVAMVPTTILLEPLSECMVLGALAAWSASLLFAWDPLVFYLVHILCWFLSDWLLLTIVQHGSMPFHKFEFVIGWLFRELTGPYLFLHALWNPAIRWRTRTFKLHWGGIAYELPLNTPASDSPLAPLQPAPTLLTSTTTTTTTTTTTSSCTGTGAVTGTGTGTGSGTGTGTGSLPAAKQRLLVS